MIHIVQDPNKFMWAGIPFYERYSHSEPAPGIKSLVKKLRLIDAHLDLKFYRPNQRWHLVRYYHGTSGSFVRVWELEEKPELGLRKDPGEWMIEALQAADTWGHAKNRVEEVDEANRQVEEKNKQNLAEACKDAAAEMRKPLQRLYDFGPDADHKEFF